MLLLRLWLFQSLILLVTDVIVLLHFYESKDPLPFCYICIPCLLQIKLCVPSGFYCCYILLRDDLSTALGNLSIHYMAQLKLPLFAFFTPVDLHILWTPGSFEALSNAICKEVLELMYASEASWVLAGVPGMNLCVSLNFYQKIVLWWLKIYLPRPPADHLFGFVISSYPELVPISLDAVVCIYSIAKVCFTLLHF